MMDEAYEWTENQIKALERRLNREYSKAVKEVQETLDDYLARFEKKDNTWSEWVEKAKADPAEYKKRQAEYKKWRTGQLAVGRRWKAMKDRLADDLHKTNVTAREIVKGKMPDIYAENHNYGTYEVEKGTRLDTSYTLYDRSTMEVLMRDNPQLLPEPGRATSQRIYNKLDVRWNRQQLQSVMMQGLLQGDSIPKLATRLANEVGDKNRKAAIRNARTMATGAQNAGRIDSYKRAKDMGIEMKQEWLAVLDERTRHDHRLMNHQVQEVDHPFEAPSGETIRFPGDPSAPAYLVYNCRCSLRALIPGLQPTARNFRDLSATETGDYETWKQSKKSRSNPITLPEEKGEAIRQSYIAEYRKKANSPILSGDNTVRESRKFYKLLNKAEKIINEKEFETAIILDDDGSVIDVVTQGKVNSVGFAPEQLAKMDGKTLTHNHPGGSTFSPEDVSILTKHGLKRILAKTDDAVFELKRQRKGIENKDYFKRDYADARKRHSDLYNELYDEIRQAYVERRLDREGYSNLIDKMNNDIEQLNRMWLSTKSQNYGYKYSEKRKKKNAKN